MKASKKITKCVLMVVLAFSFLTCKKNTNVEEISKADIQKKQIQEIIPAHYLDSLKKLGLTINIGTTPINVEGYYAIEPAVLEATNIINDYAVGYRFNDAKISLWQQDENFGIKLIGKHFLAAADTSIVTAISGVGNDFTVYGKVRAFKAGKTADVAIIFSGTMENKTIKNFKIGLICISNKNTIDNPFIKEGQGRVIVEKDKLSERITEKDFVLASSQNQSLQFSNPGIIH